MADASIRIKLGEIEVDYQGDASFLKNDLLDTVKKLLELQKQHPFVAQLSKKERPASKGKFDLSTDTIANLLGAKKGPDLVIAAAAHLHFAKGKQKFTRTEIVHEMRTAAGHYKQSYHSNLGSYLNTLKAKDRLRSHGGEIYSLSNKEVQALEGKLAEG